MPAIERLIWVTWRAFWIGLGASLVLIAQAFVPGVAARAPGPDAVVEATAAVPGSPPGEPPACAGPASTKSADPILSRNPFDSKTGPLITAPARRPRGA